MAQLPDDHKPKFTLKPKEFERVNPQPGPEGLTPSNDVRSVLAENKAVADASTEPLDLTPTPSRKKRDYVVVMLMGNAAILLVMALLPKNSLTSAFGFSAMMLFSVSVTWVMWMVMDRY